MCVCVALGFVVEKKRKKKGGKDKTFFHDFFSPFLSGGWKPTHSSPIALAISLSKGFLFFFFTMSQPHPCVFL
jgi:hypothetical protein